VKANGDVLCSFYVFKAKSDPEEQRPVSKFVLPPAKRALRGTWPRFYLFTKSSYVDKRAWKVIMETIVQRWTIENPGLWGRLFMDNFGAHRDLATVLDAYQNGIWSMFFVPNTSHVAQPLDQQPFATLKAAVNRETWERAQSDLRAGRKADPRLIEVMLELEYSVLRRGIIMSSFKRTGILPWAPDIVRSNLKAASGIPDPTSVPIEHDPAYDAYRRLIAATLNLATEEPPAKEIQLEVAHNYAFSPEELREKVEREQAAKAAKQ